MGRKNRRYTPPPDYRIERLSHGGASQVTKQGKRWLYRLIPAHRAQKVYTCPACVHPIEIGMQHIVAWEAEDLFGDSSALAHRRHWHRHCWNIFS